MAIWITLKIMRKITINNWKANGEETWVVSAWVDGKRKRSYYHSRKEAEGAVEVLKGQQAVAGDVWLTLPADQRQKLMQAFVEAKERGQDLLELVAKAKHDPAPVVKSVCPSIADVLKDMEVAKRNAGRAGGYLDSLRQIVGRFAKGREDLPLDQFTTKDVETFLNAANLDSRSTLKTRLSTFFKYAIRYEHITVNPCGKLEKIKVTKKPPAIFSIKEVEACLEWLKVNPRAFGWFALSTFAGMRPEEAQKTTWKDINFKEGWIRVEAQTTKVRQRRVVYPLPAAVAWLKQAKKLGAELPLTTKQLKNERVALRAVLEWPDWKKDVTRHTGATFWLRQSSDAKTVAMNLGHTEGKLKADYNAVAFPDGSTVTKIEAAKFWALKP
jgi:integrase